MGELKVAVFTPVKCENRYIREFVEHYRLLGFTNVILADNNDFEGEKLEDVIGDYIENSFVRVENYRGRQSSQTLQNSINQGLWDKYNQEYDWIGIFDADEYLELNPEYRTVSEFLSLDRFSEIDEIRLSWKVYGDAGQIVPINNDYSLESRFKRESNVSPATWRDCLTKAFLRGKNSEIQFSPECYKASHHGANIKGIKADVNVFGKHVNHSSANMQPVILEEAWINHYNTKSLYEFLVTKMMKGSLEGPYTFYYQAINSWWPGEVLKKVIEALGFKIERK